MKYFYLFLCIPFFAFLINLIFSLFKMEKQWLLLSFGFLVILINGILYFLSFKKDKRLAYYFVGSAFFVQVLILIFLILG